MAATLYKDQKSYIFYEFAVFKEVQLQDRSEHQEVPLCAPFWAVHRWRFRLSWVSKCYTQVSCTQNFLVIFRDAIDRFTLSLVTGTVFHSSFWHTALKRLDRHHRRNIHLRVLSGHNFARMSNGRCFLLDIDLHILLELAGRSSSSTMYHLVWRFWLGMAICWQRHDRVPFWNVGNTATVAIKD